MRAKFLMQCLPIAALAAAGCSGSPEPPAATSESVSAMADPEAPPAVAAQEASKSDEPATGAALPPDEPPALPAVEETPSVLFRADDGSFVALFPGKPEATTESLQEGGTLTVYRAAARGMERQVSAFDLPEPIGREEAEATLLSLASSIAEAAGGESIETETQPGLDFPAVRYDYVYEANGERFRTSGVLAVVDRRQYQASVLADAGSWDAASAEEFLDSFRPTYRTPTLTAPQVSTETGPSDASPAMQLLPSAPLDEESPATTVASVQAVDEQGVERELPWVGATATFPAEPESISDDATEETDRLFHAFAGSQSFTVTLHREQEPLPIEISREILAATAEAIATSVAGEEIVSEPIADERFADHRLSYRYAGEDSGPVRVRQRLLFVDAVQVYLIVAGPADDFDEAAADRFLDSFELASGDAVAESEGAEAAR